MPALTVPDAVLRYFLRLKQKGDLQSAYLFVGNSPEANFQSAQEIARLKYCQSLSYPCPGCEACQCFDRRSNYDLYAVNEEPIKREHIKAIREFLRLRSLCGRGRTVLISNIERMTEEAANAFLKILEEGPPLSLFLATTARKDLLIPTVHSRFRKIYVPAGEAISEACALVDVQTAELILNEGFGAIKDKDRKVVGQYLYWLILFLRDCLSFQLTANKDCLMDTRNYEIILRYAASRQPLEIVNILEKLIALQSDLENINVNLAKNIIQVLLCRKTS